MKFAVYRTEWLEFIINNEAYIINHRMHNLLVEAGYYPSESVFL